MKSHLKLGRVAGVTIGLHYTWVVIALLITVSLAGHFGAAHPDWTGGVVWAAAIVTGLLFFVSIILHELSHTLVAQARGLPVRSITLFALGGVSEIEKEATSAKTEFLVAIAGPASSVAIGVVCLALAALAGGPLGAEAETPVAATLTWLGYINIALAVFNMIPGFPLDGGRVLRSIIWGATGNMSRSTRTAARVGEAVALLFIAFGLFSALTTASFSGLWLALIGWFLLEAARASYAEAAVTESLRGMRVGDVAARDCPSIDPHESLHAFLTEHVLQGGRRCAIVQEGGRTLGLITPGDARRVPRERWDDTTVLEAMRPLDQVRTVTPETPVVEAMRIMGQEDLNQLPVVSDGRLVGIISRSHVLHFLQAVGH